MLPCSSFRDILSKKIIYIYITCSRAGGLVQKLLLATPSFMSVASTDHPATAKKNEFDLRYSNWKWTNIFLVLRLCEMDYAWTALTEITN